MRLLLTNAYSKSKSVVGVTEVKHIDQLSTAPSSLDVVLSMDGG